MKAYIVTTIIGVFGLNEKNEIISFKPFPKNPEKIAEKLNYSSLKVIEEEKTVEEEAKRHGYTTFIYPIKKIGVKAFEEKNYAEFFIRENLRELALKTNFVRDQLEFNDLLVKVNIELTRKKIRSAIGRDNLLIQTNRALEELDKTINILVERLREFYSIHFPEMDRIIKDHNKFAEIVKKFGRREKIDIPELKEIAEKSMGVELKDRDIKILQEIASTILGLYELRKRVSEYLEALVKEIAPNFGELAGYLLASKLIAKAGGIEKLAKSSSSFIQLLGAEKALFRFLHGKGRGPRFGLLYAHPLIQNSPEKFRGRIARVLASKLSIAIKTDYYSKQYRVEKLKRDLEEKVKKILSSKQVKL